MKNLKKLLTLIALVSISCSALALEKSKGEVLTLEDRIANLELLIKDLTEQITALEKAQSEEETTYEKCNIDGTGCKKITATKASSIIKKHKQHRIRRCQGSRCNWVKKSSGRSRTHQVGYRQQRRRN